jgi:hypothetical protein
LRLLGDIPGLGSEHEFPACAWETFQQAGI